jgi:capsular polysaccharide biosynthesis protein
MRMQQSHRLALMALAVVLVFGVTQTFMHRLLSSSPSPTGDPAALGSFFAASFAKTPRHNLGNTTPLLSADDSDFDEHRAPGVRSRRPAHRRGQHAVYRADAAQVDDEDARWRFVDDEQMNVDDDDDDDNDGAGRDEAPAFEKAKRRRRRQVTRVSKKKKRQPHRLAKLTQRDDAAAADDTDDDDTAAAASEGREERKDAAVRNDDADDGFEERSSMTEKKNAKRKKKQRKSAVGGQSNDAAAVAAADQLEPVYLDNGDLDLRLYTTLDVRDERWRPERVDECDRRTAEGRAAHPAACRDDASLVQSYDLVYKPFFLPMPLTYDEEDHKWWMQCLDYGQQIIARSMRCPAKVCSSGIKHDKVVAFYTDRFLYGRGNVVGPNATYRRDHTCGWPTDYRYDTWPSIAAEGSREHAARPEGPGGQPHFQFDKAINLLAPQSWSFQHFVNDVMPKFVQYWELLHEETDIQIIIERGRDRAVVDKILAYFDIDMSRFHDYNHKNVVNVAKEMHFGCVAPPMHPWLWQGMREIFKVKYVPFKHRKTIVILSRREGAANGGRKVLNEDAMIEEIQKLVDERGQNEKVVVFRHKDYPNFDDYLAFFNRAKVLIGPHGGAFDNLIFTPRDTLVMEFQPVERAAKRSFFPNAMMFYQTGMLDHRYYRCFEDNKGNGNMDVRIDKVISVLRRELDGQAHFRRALTHDEAVEFAASATDNY